MYVCCLHIHMCITCIPGSHGRQKRASDFLELWVWVLGTEEPEFLTTEPLLQLWTQPPPFFFQNLTPYLYIIHCDKLALLLPSPTSSLIRCSGTLEIFEEKFSLFNYFVMLNIAWLEGQIKHGLKTDGSRKTNLPPPCPFLQHCMTSLVPHHWCRVLMIAMATSCQEGSGPLFSILWSSRSIHSLLDDVPGPWRAIWDQALSVYSQYCDS